MVLWENEYFVTSNLLRSFTSEILCRILFYFPYLQKCIRINIFITIQYIKRFYLIPLNHRVSNVVSPDSFSRSSYIIYISPGMRIFALLCITPSFIHRYKHVLIVVLCLMFSLLARKLDAHCCLCLTLSLASVSQCMCHVLLLCLS